MSVLGLAPPPLAQLATAVGAPNARTTLTVPTGYAGNDVVEPSLLYDAGAPYLGYSYALCAAGYYQSNAIYENPNLWVSNDGKTWTYVVYSGGTGTATPGYAGVLTPVFANAYQGDGNLSDCYLCRGPDGTYYLLWNQFLTATGSGGTGTGGNNWGIKIATASSLAGPWSAATNVVQTVLATYRPSSPSAVWDGLRWHIYAVDLANTSATAIVHYTANVLTGPWVKQANPSIPVPAAYSSQVWWHLNAYIWNSVHLLLVQDSQAGTSGGGNLWLLSSPDAGATWVVPSKPLAAGSGFYRSAALITSTGLGALTMDCFYGNQSGSWYLSRATVGNGVAP